MRGQAVMKASRFYFVAFIEEKHGVPPGTVRNIGGRDT